MMPAKDRGRDGALTFAWIVAAIALGLAVNLAAITGQLGVTP